MSLAHRLMPVTPALPDPLILLSGPEFTWKTTTAIRSTVDERFGTGYLVEIGETGGVQHCAAPGVRTLPVGHDGTIAGIHAAIVDVRDEARARARAADRPTVLVLDSATELWALHSAWVSNRVNAAAHARGCDPSVVSSQQYWNDANAAWGRTMAVLRGFPGVVIAVCRGGFGTEYDDNGKILKGEKVWINRGQKDLPFAANVYIRMTPGQARIIGLRTADLERAVDPRDKKSGEDLPEDWTIGKLVFDRLRYDPLRAARTGMVVLRGGDNAPEPPGLAELRADIDIAASVAALTTIYRRAQSLANGRQITKDEFDLIVARLSAAKTQMEDTGSPAADEYDNDEDTVPASAGPMPTS